MEKDDLTHQAVKEYYGKIASGAGSCCQPNRQTATCCCDSTSRDEIQNPLYPAELLTTLPVEVANFTEGSGDPVSLAKLQKGETVVDLGSGGGLDCFLAARQVGENGHVIGVDMTPQMLERARANQARLQARNVEFRQGYLEALPVEDASVDVILSNCVINLSPDKPRVFNEMKRVLKPGGRIAVSDMVANRPPLHLDPDEDWCGCTSGALTDQQLREELTQAGFTDIHLEPDLGTIRAMKDAMEGDPRIGMGTDDLLENIQKWDQCERILVVPYKITARIPE